MMRRLLPVLAVCVLAGCRSPTTEHDSHAAPPGSAAAIAPDPHAGMKMPMPMTSGLPAGYAAVTINRGQAEAMKLATAAAEDVELTKSLRTVGVVTLDETRSAHVHTKVRGWIDGINVDFVGRKVTAGDTLCSIYSQDVYAAEIEFLAILQRTSSGPPLTGEFAEGERRAQGQLLDAARRRLSLWDVPKSEIARLEATREPRKTFPIVAPRSGVVVSKAAIEGSYVDPSLELYTLSDLSHLWVLVDVYEADVPYVHIGDHARLAIEGQESPADAKIAFIAPTIDEASRTLKVRFQLPNKSAALRPGAFVSAEMELHLGKGLAIPENAVIRTGARAIVFVVHGEHLQPREIKLGPLVGDRYRVDDGLAAGDQVAVGAQFLLDSESRLRATSAPSGGHVH